MSLLFHKIRQARWYLTENISSWMPEGDIPGDPLADLQTTENKLSVWIVEASECNVEQIVTALAANRKHFANLDYALFDEALLCTVDIGIKRSTGATPDKKANDSWHRDLVEVSAKRLVQLAKKMLTESRRTRIDKNKVRELIEEGLNTGRLDRELMDDELLDRIDLPKSN